MHKDSREHVLDSNRKLTVECNLNAHFLLLFYILHVRIALDIIRGCTRKMWRTERNSIMRGEIADENDEKGKTFEFSSNFFLICLLQFSIPFFCPHAIANYEEENTLFMEQKKIKFK